MSRSLLKLNSESRVKVEESLAIERRVSCLVAKDSATFTRLSLLSFNKLFAMLLGFMLSIYEEKIFTIINSHYLTISI